MNAAAWAAKEKTMSIGYFKKSFLVFSTIALTSGVLVPGYRTKRNSTSGQLRRSFITFERE
jgi:hypothetical protein